MSANRRSDIEDRGLRKNPQTMQKAAATPYLFVAALVLLTAFGCSGPPAASDPPDPSKVLENPAIPPDPIVATGPLAIISERSSSSVPSETVVPFNPKSSDSDAPHQRIQDGKQFMLGLINEERRKAGVPELSLGDNNAAQIQAENSISDCVSGHWGTDGLGPPMRYSLAESYQSNRENASGYNYCLTDENRPMYLSIQSVQSELRDHMNGYLGSPGHKENILYPWHRKVNLGLSWDTHQMWSVQHFEGDYADCSVPPTIQGTTLSVTCTVSEVLPSRSLAQAIYFDSPPHALSRGQIARSYSYRTGKMVALLRKKAQAGYSYSVNEVTRTHNSGCTPYDFDPSEPAPSSFAEATSLYNQAKLCMTSEESITVPWIDGEETVGGATISLSHDIEQVLTEHGNGVYTLFVWGCSVADSVANPCEDDNSMPIITQSIFYGIDPPDTYTPTSESSPTPTPTPSATTQRVDCGSAVSDQSNTGLVSDCEILLGLKDTIRGSASLNWSASLPITQWTGVRLAGTPQRVTIIKLQKRSLTGSIPAGLGSLAKLQDLWLYTNELTGPLPAELGNLSDLETLMLSHNDLSGQIPLTLNDLSLQRLWLKGNNFTGCMPANLLNVPDGDAAGLRLPTCETGTTTPTPTATPTPTPTPTPTMTPADDLTELLDLAHCNQADLTQALGVTHTLVNAESFLDYEHNGWGLQSFTRSSWVNDNDSDKIVFCVTLLYENVSSAVLDAGYDRMRSLVEGSLDVLDMKKVGDLPEIGHSFRALQMRLGEERIGTGDNNPLAGVTVSVLRRGRLAVFVSERRLANNVNPSLRRSATYPPPVSGVVAVSQRIDARLAELSESAYGGATIYSGAKDAR